MQNKIYNKICGRKKSFTTSPAHQLISSGGFTLLFASLVGSLVFTIGIAILNISIKQITLTSAGRESQQSFYSADAGIECALLLDRGAGDPNCRTGFFGVASSTALSGISVCDQDMGTYAGAPSCFGQAISINSENYGGTVMSSFELVSNPDTDICFSVVVTKLLSGEAVNSVIEARGYNTCSTNSTRFERAIKTYNY